jgi:Tol biopolymer transport system component
MRSAFQIWNISADTFQGSGLFETNDALELSPVVSPSETRVAFVSSRDANLELYVRNIDRTGLRRLTTHPGDDFDPARSPDGQRIVFSRESEGSSDIHVIGADGTGLTRLTTSAGHDWSPSWSPDGAQIVFASGRDGDSEIYVMNADGGEARPLTANSVADDFPRWSPDGSRIAFSSDRDGDDEIYAMSADGSTLTQLTSTPEFEYDWDPSWSPDGTRIAFTSNRDDPADIFVMNADGSGQQNATRQYRSYEFGASFRGRGQALMFASDYSANMDVEVAALNGSARSVVFSSPNEDLLPKWSPDGKLLAFSSLGDGDLEICVISPTREGVQRGFRQLTQNRDAQDLHPAWSPDGKRIAYVRQGAEGSSLQILNVAGRGTRFVMEGDELTSPAWSPDGTKIALARDDDIVVVGTNGKGLRQLTGAGSTRGRRGRPTGDRSSSMRVAAPESISTSSPPAEGESSG